MMKYVVDEPVKGLVITRRVGESITIDVNGELIEVIVWGGDTRSVRIAVLADKKHYIRRNPDHQRKVVHT